MVGDIFADAMPAQLVRAITRQLRKTKHSHALVVKRIWLGQVKNVEFDAEACACVADTEEEPLSVTVCVYVVLQYQVILIVADFHRAQEVACLET